MREIQLEDLYPPNKRPKHCGKPMRPEAGDGIWECLKCGGYTVLDGGVPTHLQGRDLAKAGIKLKGGR